MIEGLRIQFYYNRGNVIKFFSNSYLHVVAKNVGTECLLVFQILLALQLYYLISITLDP